MGQIKSNSSHNEQTTVAYLTWEHICAIINAATNLRDRLLMWLLSRLGCRISEALAILVNDINFSLGTITIQHLKRRLKLTCPHCKARLSGNHTFCPGCGRKVSKAVKEKLEQDAKEYCQLTPIQ